MLLTLRWSRARTARHSVPQISPFGRGARYLLELAPIPRAAAGQGAGRSRWLAEKMDKLRLCQVCLGHLGLNEIGKSFDNELGERCPIMAPSPSLHATDTKVSSYRGIAAKGHFEREIMPSASHTTLEARSGYGIATYRHDGKVCICNACAVKFLAIVTRNQVQSTPIGRRASTSVRLIEALRMTSGRNRVGILVALHAALAGTHWHAFLAIVTFSRNHLSFRPGHAMARVILHCIIFR
jgi:hypothetical protein